LTGDGRIIKHHDFLADGWSRIDTRTEEETLLGGHGGGDYGLMRAFVDAVRHNDPGRILSGPSESLKTHLMVFAAERSRTESRVVGMDEMLYQHRSG
jgi:hypothetical protein